MYPFNVKHFSRRIKRENYVHRVLEKIPAFTFNNDDTKSLCKAPNKNDDTDVKIIRANVVFGMLRSLALKKLHVLFCTREFFLPIDHVNRKNKRKKNKKDRSFLIYGVKKSVDVYKDAKLPYGFEQI